MTQSGFPVLSHSVLLLCPSTVTRNGTERMGREERESFNENWNLNCITNAAHYLYLGELAALTHLAFENSISKIASHSIELPLGATAIAKGFFSPSPFPFCSVLARAANRDERLRAASQFHSQIPAPQTVVLCSVGSPFGGSVFP